MRNDNGQFTPKHGMYLHRHYGVWAAMIGRCDNPANHAYQGYGGRGIFVCKEWYCPKTFIEWLEAQGYDHGLHLDRIDNDGPYSPENCRVVTPKENSRNRRDNVRYSVHGEMLTAGEVEEKYGVKQGTFIARVTRYNKTPEQAVINHRKMPEFEWQIDGKMMSSKEVSEKYGINRALFIKRLSQGWEPQRAAQTPVRG